MRDQTSVSVATYEAPRLVVVGAVDELTAGCDKQYGHTDGFTFQGQTIVCASA